MLFARAIAGLSSVVVSIERVLLILLVMAMAGFVLMNVLLRMAGITIAWADEMAVYSMIMSGFVGASLMLRGRLDPAVLLLHEFLPDRAVSVLRVVISVTALAFGLMLIHLCWRWFNPAALAQAGFDVNAFEGATFNFIYTDKTPVLGMSTFWFYLIMPWFALTLSVHAAANLMEDLGWIDRAPDPVGVERTEA